MAFYTDTIDHSAKPRRSKTVLTVVTDVFSRFIAAQSRSLDVQRMQHLSDRELADMGLNRDDIVRHVYRDIYYV